MKLTRRSFLLNTTCAGASLAAGDAIGPLMAQGYTEPLQLTPYLTGIRMAGTPATAYRAYRSKVVATPETTTWIQVDLGKNFLIEAIQLFPASERMYPGRDQYYAGEGFPLRFRIDASADSSFSSPANIADFTQADFPDPKDNITQYSREGINGRYVRLTATRLRAVKVNPPANSPMDNGPRDGPDFTLTLAKMAVLSGGKDVAVGCKVAADSEHGNLEFVGQITRVPRQDGEGIHFDHPNTVTNPSLWKPAKFKAEAPKTGVALNGGLFQTAIENNIEYLLSTYSTEDLLRQFYERTGRIKNFKPVGSQIFWEEDLAGSNAGRFLMGAGNTIRWIDHPELSRRVNAVVDGIEECRQPNGYIMAYPEDTIFYSERAAYTRAWLTHGLLEAAYAGNSKALPMLRGYYDWFNRQPFLPEMLRGAIQGGQGMVANTRMGRSPVGKPDDAQVIQQYYEETAWLQGLARREKGQVWQYPYDRPHCYLLTNLEAYLDMYLITGDPRYYEAVLGAWELYRAHWQQVGGSISIIEFEQDPPDSNYLKQKLGELCGSSFWVFLNQRFQQLHPDDERFATEIEKSIYNVGIANQDGMNGLRYHTIMEGRKEKATHKNTCCEGQGTRLLGSLPEHIYSVASDGLYVNLFEPSTIRWKQSGQPMELAMLTRFPYETAVRCTVRTDAPTEANLRVRIPSWAAKEMKISVNGKPIGAGRPGTYFSLNRRWMNGDTFEFVLPAVVRATTYKGADQIEGKTGYAFEYGPILLAAVGLGDAGTSVDAGMSAEQIASRVEPIEEKPLHFQIRGNPGLEFMPYWQISDEEFTCYPTMRTSA
jgi:uncharacterized protein